MTSELHDAHKEHEHRLSKNEQLAASTQTEMRNLSKDLHTVTESIRSISSDVHNLSKEFRKSMDGLARDLYTRIEDRTSDLSSKMKFPWAQFYGGLGIVMAVFSFIINYILDDFKETLTRDRGEAKTIALSLGESLKSVDQRLYKYMMNDRQEVFSWRLKRLEQDIESLNRSRSNGDMQLNRLNFWPAEVRKPIARQ